MTTGELLQPHNYTFDTDCRVDARALHPATLGALEWTNYAYRSNRGLYVHDTYAALGRTNDRQGFARFHQNGDSRTDLVLVYNPFGQPMFPRHSAEDMAAYVEDRQATAAPKGIDSNDASKLFQARFLYDALHFAGVTDSEGRNLPVAAFSAPSVDHTSPLTRKERWTVARGDLSPLSARPLEQVKKWGYNRLYVAGYSLGAVAAGAVRLAQPDFDVLAGSFVGDAPNFKRRFPIQPVPLGILLPYALDSIGSDYEGDWVLASQEPRADIARNGESYDAIGNWAGNGNKLINLAIGKGLSHKVLPKTLAYMQENQIPTAIGWSESKLMRGFEPFIKKDPSARQLALDGLLSLYCARQAPHLSGENQIFLTDVMVRSILAAQKPSK